MSSFDDDFDVVDDMFAEAFGSETITIVDATGTEHEYADAVVGDEKTEQRQTEYGTEIVVTRVVSIKTTETDGRYSLPQVLNLRGTMVVGTARYSIEQVITSRSGNAILKTKRVSFAEVSREQYRRNA